MAYLTLACKTVAKNCGKRLFNVKVLQVEYCKKSVCFLSIAVDAVAKGNLSLSKMFLLSIQKVCKNFTLFG